MNLCELMTADLPARPEYFQRDVDLNRQGAAALADLPAVPALSPQKAASLQKAGATILDTRAAAEFCSGHIPGSINIGLNGQFASWAGSVLGLDRDLILLAEDQKTVDESRQRLARVGIERVVGFVENGIAGWVRAGLPLEPTNQISVHDLEAELTDGANICVIDVRRPLEWNSGHLADAVHAPLDGLRRGLPLSTRTARLLSTVRAVIAVRSHAVCFRRAASIAF